MILVDTNIIAPLFIRSAHSDLVDRLRLRDALWQTEPFALIELSNILATYLRARYLAPTAARQCLVLAENFLRPHFEVVEHEIALDAAIRFGVTGYDARFLALAERLSLPLVTEDAKLRRAAPTLTQSLEEALHLV